MMNRINCHTPKLKFRTSSNESLVGMLKKTESHIISREQEIYGGYLPKDVLMAIKEKSKNFLETASLIEPNKTLGLRKMLRSILKNAEDVSEIYCVWDEVGERMSNLIA